MNSSNLVVIFIAITLLLSCKKETKEYDVIISGGTVYDGFGEAPYVADIGIKGGEIAFVGDMEGIGANQVVDASNMAVCPGFINVLSQYGSDVFKDGRGLSDLYQGVTTQIIGEGVSMAPITAQMQVEWEYPEWQSFSEFMDVLEKTPKTQNIGSMVGATTLRINVLGNDSVVASSDDMAKMRALAAESMEAGALGLSSALIYTPASYASTEEIISLAKEVQQYGGIYASHIRSEGTKLVEAVDEFMEILDKADIRGEIYHLKAIGKENWAKLDKVIAKIDSAQTAGLQVSTDMYAYSAASTGLNACFPPWVKSGGLTKWLDRMKNPLLRDDIIRAIKEPSSTWENFYHASNGPENIVVTGFKEDSLQYLAGKNLFDISRLWNIQPEEALIDLVLKNGTDVNAIYFVMDEQNIRKKVQLPYMTFCSDSGALAAERENLESKPHPRTYGNFSRILETYVLNEGLIGLEEAIHKMTLMPALNFGIVKRGAIAESWRADILVFDPNEIRSKASYVNPHQYASGMKMVFINGVKVLNENGHLGKYPGMVIRGPGYVTDK